MARKAKEILLARGYTEEELTSMATLLADQKFCAAIEAEANDADTHKTAAEKLQADLEADATWYRETAAPALTKATKDAIDAKEKAAGLEAKLQSMQDYGLLKVAEGEGGKGKGTVVTDPKAVESNPNFDASKFVSTETFQQTASQFGNAIAMAQDIADDHKELFGTRLPGGVSKLREDYQKAVQTRRFGGSLREFYEDTYKVAAKRDEISAAARTKEIADAIAAEKTKWVSEQANPMTRTLGSSRNPFTNRAQAGSATDGGKGGTAPTKPWEKNEGERANQRVSKFASKVLQSA